MNKGYYVVHLHRIEDSYCFGVFDSMKELRKALRLSFEGNAGFYTRVQKSIENIREFLMDSVIVPVEITIRFDLITEE